MEQAPPSPLTAQCQLHTGQPFTAVCQRCGTYMCAVCSEGGRQALCMACRERSGVGSFPFRRDAYTLSALFEYAWNAYKQHWLTLVGAVVIMFVTMFAISGIGSLIAFLFTDHPVLMGIVQAIFAIPQLFFQGLFTIGILHVAIKVARGEPTEIADVFSPWRKLGSWLLQFLILFGVFFPLIAVVVGISVLLQQTTGSPGLATFGVMAVAMPFMFYVMMGFAFGNLEIVAQPGVGALAGLRNSWAISRGKRLELVLIGLAAIALYIGGILACLVGALFTMTYAAVLFASYYLTLRNGASDLRT
jgi:hypothetical protein